MDDSQTNTEKPETDLQSLNIEKRLDSGDSLSLSLTPPVPEDTSNPENSEGTISEHLTSADIENDRSFAEIEVSNRPPDNSLNLLISNDVRNLSEEQASLLDSSARNIDSLNPMTKQSDVNVDAGKNAQSILDEILHSSQFISDEGACVDSKEESLDIFKNVNFDDTGLKSYGHKDDGVEEKNLYASNFDIPLATDEDDFEKQIKDCEELIAIKDGTIEALMSELDSVRELSNPNTGSSTLSTTEYKQLQEECNNKLLEYNSIIIYKNDLIRKLSESLDQSVSERRELLTQIDRFKYDIAQLQEQLQETTKMVAEHECKTTKTDDLENLDHDDLSSILEDAKATYQENNPNINVDNVYADLEKTLNLQQKSVLGDLKLKLDAFVKHAVTKAKAEPEEEIKELKAKNVLVTEDYESEISKLRQLLASVKCGSTEIMELKTELEAKHSREMEELRTYFEKKCSDLEKNYSEEIFSQQSRKLSGSTCSEAELNSDVIFPHPPGPDGDMRYDLQPNITKKDLIGLQNELTTMLDKVNKYNLDNMTDEEFGNLKSEIGKSNLNVLLKYDIAVIKRDLQNKCHAELEVLREDGENRVDVLNVQYELKLKSLENKYMEEIDNLKAQLDEMQRNHLSISSAVQEVRLAANEAEDEEWPSELLQLKDKFAERYEDELQTLQKEHQDEIDRLKEEHLKVLNGALDRAKRRSLKDSDSLSKSDLEILRERDNLKKQISSLRNLLGELLKYFTQCEDELNKTLVDELLKQGFDKDVLQLDDDLNMSLPSNAGDNPTNITRVHLTPNFNDLINLIETTCQDDCDESKDISTDLKNELSMCLEKLKQEANGILALTASLSKKRMSSVSDVAKSATLEEKVNSLTRQCISETQAKERLREELDENVKYVETLEKERDSLEGRLDEIIAKGNLLEADLVQARSKIAELIENGHREVVSEGYGEEGSRSQGLGDTTAILSELQEKARSMLVQSRATAEPSLLHLIEELCRVGERIKEEAKRERQDLLQQIDVADKKYKTTQKFLEEQAFEREQERDEAQKKIDMFYGQLRERDKDKMNCERVTSEAEQLEQQLQEMTKVLQEENQRYKDLESERNEAVEKIKILRDIIRDLEAQSEGKSSQIEDYVQAIQKLECLIEQQDSSLIRLKQGDSVKDVSEIGELYRHIEHLEGELQQLRVNSELAGSEGVTHQIKKQIFELEIQIDKKTKALEVLHSTESTNCSSPSEDISARDLVRTRSPNVMDECEVPLQQLARLKEKLMRHSRAEDAAIKRIKDLEMQVFSLRSELEESNGEKEYMKKQLQEQLVLISDLQIRLDEQRIRAEHIEKQTNTSLELKIYDLQNEIVSLQEKLDNKEKSLSQQKMSLTETQQRLKSLEKEMSSAKDDEIIVAMQKDLEAVRAENFELKAKIQKESQMVPNLVGNIISDKNMDIEKLRDKLEETEKLLEMYTSLNLDKRDIHTLSNLKTSGSSLTQVLSILDLSQADQMRRLDSLSYSQNLSDSRMAFPAKVPDDTLLEPEVSAIVGPPDPHSSGAHLRNSTELSQKHVHFEDAQIEKLRIQIAEFDEKLKSKDEIIKNYEDRLKLLNSLENKIEKLQLCLDETEKALADATKTFEGEQQDSGVKLAEVKMHLSQKEKRIAVLEQDSARKDEMCLNLAKDKKDLEQALNEVKLDSFNSIDAIVREKTRELESLQAQISAKNQEYSNIKKQLVDKDMESISLQSELENRRYKLENLQTTFNALEKRLENKNDECSKLNKELQNKLEQVEAITNEMNNVREKLNKKRKLVKDQEDQIEKHKHTISTLESEVKKQRDVITDQKCELDIVNEDAKRYQNDIAELEYELKLLKKSDVVKLKQQVEEKNSKADELAKEKAQLSDLVGEKEKIINQMAEDSHQLHLNLVTIKSKLKEPGNIIDMGNKLKDEQKRTADLLQEVHSLKAQLMIHKNSTISTNSVEDITDQLKKELDYSAQIDSNIMYAVSDHSLSPMSETQDVGTYKKVSSKEKMSKKQLLSQISSLQTKNIELQNLLEKERCSLLQIQMQDAELIGQLRVQLDAALDNEEGLKTLLEEKKAACEQLERVLEMLKRKNVSSSSKTESTEYRSLPTKEILELNLVRKEFDLVQNERNQLLSEMMLLNQAKLEAESSYRCTKEMLNLEVQRANELEERVGRLTQVERELKEEMIQKRAEIEKLMGMLEQERASFAKQKDTLLEQLKASRNSVTEATHSTTLTDDLLNKIKQLNSALLDNRKLMECLQKVTHEKQKLEDEVAQLRRDEPNHVLLQELINQYKSTFARNLKLESVKKALIWQKRYLSEYLQSHQEHCAIQALPDTDRFRNEFYRKPKPKKHFRSVVYAVISIIRMKYLVIRWHSGVRVADKVSLRHYKNLLSQIDTPALTNFHVGQPVSHQVFLNAPSRSRLPTNPFDIMQRGAEGNLGEDRLSGVSETEPGSLPWSGNTPPSKDRSNGRIKIGSTVLQREDLSPLQAPELLARFIERFDQIQESLGVVLDKSST